VTEVIENPAAEPVEAAAAGCVSFFVIQP